MAGQLLSRNFTELGNKLVDADDIGIFTDADGTLSEIEEHPDLSRVAPEITQALTKLNQVYGMVVVVSGRRAQEVQNLVGADELLYLGNHGFERRKNNRTTKSPGLEKAARRIAIVKSELAEHLPADPGIFIEDKDLVLAIHYRNARNTQAKEEVRLLAARVAGENDLIFQNGREVTEIRPKGVDKGQAVLEVIRENGLAQAIYIGDDTTDVDAFRALKHVSKTGEISCICVAVVNEESPAALKENADYLVESIEEVKSFLLWLVELARGRSSKTTNT